ncbi:secreted protein [Moniliophthora roreri MCA 2997]|uniref:Secreted protein n=2 Tax=Moniliophthora roreri TaxID=221103 RepID=V2X514_MONRO|nr:secreted protein [Moniliophthora roreri MCA 2997]
MFSSLLVTVVMAASALCAVVGEGVVRVERPTATVKSPAATTSLSVPTQTGPPNLSQFLISLPYVDANLAHNLTHLTRFEWLRMPTGRSTFSMGYQHTAVTITFSAFEASVGPDISITEGRKNCQVSLNVHVPQGFSFAIVDVDYRGFYQLDDKVKGFHDAVYYFQGQLVQSEATSTLVGPIAGKNYVYRDEFNLTPTIYSPCGEDTVLNINSQVRVDNTANRKGYGFITDDSIDASITQTFNFQWLQC